MIFASRSSDFFQSTHQAPIPLAEWKTTLSRWTTHQTAKLATAATSDFHRASTSTSSAKKHARKAAATNQVVNEPMLNSFLLPRSASVYQSSISLSRQDVPRLLSSSNKPYLSSFKTLVNSTTRRRSQRLHYANDSVIIFKLSKETTSDDLYEPSKLSSKHSASPLESTTSSKSVQSTSYPLRLNPIQKVEGKKRRTEHDDPSALSSAAVEMAVASTSIHHLATAMSSNHAQTNPSSCVYRSTTTLGASGHASRQRSLIDPTTNSLFISTEKYKSPMLSSVRPTRQTLMPSTFISSQPAQRHVPSNARSRLSGAEKVMNAREVYDYPDPFTNCPSDVLNKLSQLTRLQLETIDWEKRRRFTKKRAQPTGTTQGKDASQ